KAMDFVERLLGCSPDGGDGSLELVAPKIAAGAGAIVRPYAPATWILPPARSTCPQLGATTSSALSPLSKPRTASRVSSFAAAISTAISSSPSCRDMGAGAGRRAISGAVSVSAWASPSEPCSIQSQVLQRNGWKPRQWLWARQEIDEPSGKQPEEVGKGNE